MANKRLHILFHANSMALDGEESDLQAIVKYYKETKNSWIHPIGHIITSDSYCICLQHVIAMVISDIPPDLASEQIKFLRKQSNDEGDEPWKRSLRPDPDDDE